MNLEQLKKSIGFRVQLAPPAIHLDGRGQELPTKNEDWIIEAVTDTELRLAEATIRPLTTKTGRDSVHHFTSNPARSTPGGVQYGFLTLTVQMLIQQDRISYQPCRPGDRTPPPAPVIAQMWVDFKYPVASGIQGKLELAGYRVAWIPESRLAGLELQGWDLVIEKDRHGMPTTFHLRTNPENMVFVKTLTPDLQALANNRFWKTQPGLVSCTLNSNGDALVFRFADPPSAVAFQMRMARGPSGLRCQSAPGRVDTVIGYPTGQ